MKDIKDDLFFLLVTSIIRNIFHILENRNWMSGLSTKLSLLIFFHFDNRLPIKDKVRNSTELKGYTNYISFSCKWKSQSIEIPFQFIVLLHRRLKLSKVKLSNL